MRGIGGRERRRRSGLVHWKISYYNRASCYGEALHYIVLEARGFRCPPARLARATPHSFIEESIGCSTRPPEVSTRKVPKDNVYIV